MSDIIWILKPKNENHDYTDIVVKISNNEDVNLSDYDIGQINSVVHSFKDEIVDYLIEHGFSSLVSSELILEHIVTKGTADNQIILLVQKYLDKLNIDNELIIVDPYFFAKNPKNPNYITVLEQILDKYIASIDALIIVTNSKADHAIKTSITNLLQGKKPSLSITHKVSDDYHDRYWISGGRNKGVVIGTSLNSLGNKVALLDRLNNSDVKAIVDELKKDGLL